MGQKSLPSAPLSKREAVMLISPGRRDAMSAQLTNIGCRVIAVRRLADLEERFVRSDAAIVLVDLRGAIAEGIDALVRLAALAESGGVTLVGIYSRKSPTTLAKLVQAGVSMVLPAPFASHELVAIIELAGRATRRTLRIPPPLLAGASSRDVLTGLADPQMVRKWVDDHLVRVPVSLLLVNLTRFDTVNAAFGRHSGDAALRAVAHRVEPIVEEITGVDVLFARLRGAEFAIAIAGDISAGRLQLVAEALFDTIGRPFSTGKDMVQLGCRIGVVRSKPSDRSATTLLRRANSAITKNPNAETGPIRTLIGADVGAAELVESLQADLRAAVGRGEIDILFQPQVGIASGRIEGVEALARWDHPAHGEIGAATLFAVAEQSDFMVELSRHIQRKAVSLAAGWPMQLSHLRLAVNVTAADIALPRFSPTFLAMVDETCFPRERLTVEVTESGLMSDLEGAAQVFNQLRAAGCRIAIDDFGTGYSSLAYLNALPADYLKIDKGLAGDILASERASLVVRSVIGLARSLGLSVIAEGVESEGQLALLAREGCNLYQGFLRARPLTLAALIKMVTDEN